MLGQYPKFWLHRRNARWTACSVSRLRRLSDSTCCFADSIKPRRFGRDRNGRRSCTMDFCTSSQSARYIRRRHPSTEICSPHETRPLRHLWSHKGSDENDWYAATEGRHHRITGDLARILFHTETQHSTLCNGRTHSWALKNDWSVYPVMLFYRML